MPDKEGSEDNKSTKSVVNKKQKQMMGEEGYDIARDMGKVSPSKDKKDATTMPVSDEVKKTQKKSKGKSAVELVKASYGKSVMNGKKKANEELDLTKVAEAFGGYIVEANGKKKSKSERSLDRFTDPRITKDPFDPPSDEEAARLKFEIDKKERKFTSGDDPRYKEKPGETRERVTGTKKGRDTKSKNVSLKPTTSGGKVTTKYASKSDERAAAASDALDDMIGDEKQKGKVFLGKPTAEVKQDAKKTVEKPLADRVKSDKDKLTSRVKERSVLRKSRSAQRQALAVGGALGGKTGSLSKGNLEFPGDRSGATSQAKFDIDFQKILKRQGGTGDLGPKMSTAAKRAAQAKRNKRMKDQGTPDPFDVYKKKQATAPELDSLQTAQQTTDASGKRTIASMNPSERAARGIGGGSSSGGSTEGSGGAGSSRVSGGKKVTDFTTGKEVERKVPEKGGSVVVYNQRKGKDFVKNSRKVNMDTSGIMGQGDKSGQALRPVNNTRIQNIKATSAIALDKYTKFAQKNPALGFATYDLGKGIIGKITKLRMPSVQGGKAGFRSAGG